MDDEYTSSMNRELQVAWAAGFLDGEGCFNLSKSSGQWAHETAKSPVLHASQVRTVPLDRLVELFGGTVRPFRVTSAGNLSYQWCITGKQLVPILEELIPHLVVKQGEAKAVLAYCKTIGVRGHKGQPRGSSQWTIAHRRAIIARHTSARRGGVE